MKITKSLYIRKMQIKTIRKLHFIPTRMATIQKQDKASIGEVVEKKGTPIYCWLECKQRQQLWKTIQKCLRNWNLKIDLPQGPAISLLPASCHCCWISLSQVSPLLMTQQQGVDNDSIMRQGSALSSYSSLFNLAGLTKPGRCYFDSCTREDSWCSEHSIDSRAKYEPNAQPLGHVVSPVNEVLE